VNYVYYFRYESQRKNAAAGNRCNRVRAHFVFWHSKKTGPIPDFSSLRASAFNKEPLPGQQPIANCCLRFSLKTPLQPPYNPPEIPLLVYWIVGEGDRLLRLSPKPDPKGPESDENPI
jgi:hypothetical protein